MDTSDVAQLLHLETIIRNVLSVAAWLLGIAVFVMLIVGGLEFLTSTGDPKKAEKARQTITGALLGIFLVILGWFALNILTQLAFSPGTLDLTKIDLSFPSP